MELLDPIERRMKPRASKARLTRARAGSRRRVRNRATTLRVANDGLGNVERKWPEPVLASQRRVLEMIAAGAPLTESLNALVRLIEEQTPGMLGSILLLDGLKHHFIWGAASSLSPSYLKSIYGLPIGPAAGSCGTAAFRKESVVVKDIATDPLWKNYRKLALPYGLRACWSTPIFSAKRELLGTFAMYYRRPRLPELEHKQWVEMATHIASIAICRDRSASALRESEAKLKEAQRICGIGYCELDFVNGRAILSEESRRIFGLPPKEGALSPEDLMKMIHPEDRRIQKEALEAAMSGRQPFDLEFRIVRPDGDVRFVHCRDEMSRDGLGRPIRMFGTVQDITDQKQAEELLKAREHEIRAIVEHSPDPIVRFDRNLRVTYVNPAFIRINGGSREALLGRTVSSVVKEGLVSAAADEVENMERSLRVVLDTEMPLDFEPTWSLPDGMRYFAVHLEPEFDAHRNFVSILSIGRDITELKKSEDRLRQTELELARVARLTIIGELTASIAHEVNQPLAGVVTNANAALRWLAMSPPDLREARQAVQRIAADGNRASGVIQRVRDLMKKSEPTRKPVNLNDIVRETVTLIQPELKRKKVSLKTELAPGLPLVSADFVQMQQVLLNLIVNAIDSLSVVTDRPRGLNIRTNRLKSDAVQVAVKDTGVGIDPEDTEHLFKPFYTTKPGGLGMGLAISRSIVEAQGGWLWAKPNRPHGAIFRFSLPVRNGNAGES